VCVLLGFLQKTSAFPIMNPLLWFMICSPILYKVPLIPWEFINMLRQDVAIMSWSLSRPISLNGRMSEDLTKICIFLPSNIGKVTVLYLFLASARDFAWRSYIIIINMYVHTYVYFYMCTYLITWLFSSLLLLITNIKCAHRSGLS